MLTYLHKCISLHTLGGTEDNDGMFDVTKESFDGTEVCELVGLFILNDLAHNTEQTTLDSTRTMDSPFSRTQQDLIGFPPG